MIKKKLFTLIVLFCISQETHAAGFFNKAVRGLYHTTKWGLIAAPLLTAGAGIAGYKYLENSHSGLKFIFRQADIPKIGHHAINISVNGKL